MTTAREIFHQQRVERLYVPWAPGEAVSYSALAVYGGDSEPIPVIEIPDACSEDGFGQTTFLEISNFHHLVENHPDQIMVVEYLNLDRVMVLANAELPEDFADKLLGYWGYPVFDEEDLAAREYDEWLRSWEFDGYNRIDLEYELGRTLTPEEDERLFDVLDALDAYQGETDPCACYPARGIAPIAAALDPGYTDAIYDIEHGKEIRL